MKMHAMNILVLWHLDLETLRSHLQPCYAPNPRGSRPWDPILLLRCYLLGLLLGENITRFVARLRAERVLRIIAGLPDPRPGDGVEVVRTPGVGTFYDFFHRLHDGPHERYRGGVVRPSEDEKRSVKALRRLESKTAKKTYVKGGPGARKVRKKKEAQELRLKEESLALTEKIAMELDKSRESSNPEDFTTRLNTLLLEAAVRVSAQKGLLGKLDKLVISGDGSPLPTGASGHGRKECGHSKRERCECPRRFADPNAQRGYDAFRKSYYFGYHFYELVTGSKGHDLPLYLTLAPANVPENGMALRSLERLRKHLRDWMPNATLGTAIFDAGHDNMATHRYLISHGIKPVIPLSCDAPARHPTRPDLKLSPKGFPLCEGHAEMAAWGSAGKGTSLFLCPVKAGKLARCPIAPEGAEAWSCQPHLKFGPAVVVRCEENPRLFPEIQRNSKRYSVLYPKRTASERSNSVKKEVFGLVRARHRRQSFWLIRLVSIAILQHARAWVADIDLDVFLTELLAPDSEATAA